MLFSHIKFFVATVICRRRLFDNYIVEFVVFVVIVFKRFVNVAIFECDIVSIFVVKFIETRFKIFIVVKITLFCLRIIFLCSLIFKLIIILIETISFISSIIFVKTII